MPHNPNPLWILCFAALSAVTSATSIRPDWLLERADTCAAADFSKCSQPGLPANFCCNNDSTCTVLAGNTTVLCCPSGSDCSTIQPITCNLTFQDPAANPSAEIKTTVLDGKLETCDSGCCPFGYHCVDHNCIKNEDQTQKPEGGASTGDGKPTTSATSDPTAGGTSAASVKPTNTAVDGGVAGGAESAAPSSDTPDATAARTMNTAAIVGGVVGGIVALIAIIAAIMLLRHRRKQKAAKKRLSSSSSFGNFISQPIPQNEYTSGRSDFISKTQAQSSSIASTPTQAQERFPPHSPYSPYSGRRDSEMAEMSPRSHHASAEIGGLRSLTDNPYRWSARQDSIAPYTPTPKDRRQPSSASGEDVAFYADAETIKSSPFYGSRRDTTWSGIQRNADTVPDSPVRRR
ncbi:hypothetical protein F5Y15DRAFT_359378 [Xylariaceae sp. FL0016]|nr:hypothetical protein F5Y15DRAFT_359378 [Xylariaceae sp. FL0016]